MSVDGVSIVVPVFRSETTLEELVRRLKASTESLAPAFEILLVEDGGGGGSWELIQKLAGLDARVRGLRLGRNYGQHNALLCGIRAARYETIVTLDDDLQHPPEEIPLLLKALEEGYDVVYGFPLKKQHGFWRRLNSRLVKLVLRNGMGEETAERMSPFRAFRTSLRDAFSDFKSPFVSIDALLTWGTNRFLSVDVRHDPRKNGKSNYTIGKLLLHGINVLAGFSTIPLRLASLLGFGMTLFGLAVLSYVVGRYLITGSSFPGFPFLASVISIFAGTQLFALGIIGEYLARMHERLIEKPAYMVRATTF